jgi:acyl carrier protein
MSKSEENTLELKVRSCFAEIVGVPLESVRADANVFEVYGLDSPRALKLISDVEVEFDIDIEEEEAQQIRTLNDVIRLIRAKRVEV